MSHLTQEQKLAYISGRLDEEVSFAVDEHLATCSQCAGSIRALRILRHDFDRIWDRIWDGWTAKAHGQAYREARLAAALIKAAEKTAQTPALRKRIQRWLGRVREGVEAAAEAALHLVLDSPRKTAQVISEGMEELRRAGSRWQFEPVPSVATEGPFGGPEEAAPSKIAVKAEGPPWFQVNVDVQAGKVSVLLELQEEPWPLLLLQPTRADQDPIIGEFRRPEEMDFLLAEFEGVPEGEYLLLMEPLEEITS